MTSICVIPARGGSKRIPRKNIRPFAGLPLLSRTIGIVLDSGVADRVMVSTDDPEIADVARSAGAEVPFLREPDLADDHTPTIPVIADTLRRLTADGHDVADTTWVVYPTAVLLEPRDLVQARDLFISSGTTAAMSVIQSPAPIERSWRQAAGGSGYMASPDFVETRTQDLPTAFFDAGQFYVATTEFWLSNTTLADAGPLLLPLPRERATDIDTVDDWKFAESLFAARSAITETDRLEKL